MEIVVIGTGKMAKAVIEGIKKEHHVIVVGRDKEKLEEISKKYKVDIDYIRSFNIHNRNIILCIKPHALKAMKENLLGRARLLMSVLAGTDISTIKKYIKANQYIRIMPNIAATHKKSMTTLTGDERSRQLAEDICSSFGKTLWVDSEKELDIATAVAGSGPAFLALVAEALSDGAVKEGLKREDANLLVKGLFDGFNHLIKTEHPALIKDSVMSPGGTTAAGYSALEEGSTRSNFIKAISKAYKKTL